MTDNSYTSIPLPADFKSWSICEQIWAFYQVAYLENVKFHIQFKNHTLSFNKKDASLLDVLLEKAEKEFRE